VKLSLLKLIILSGWSDNKKARLVSGLCVVAVFRLMVTKPLSLLGK